MRISQFILLFPIHSLVSIRKTILSPILLSILSAPNSSLFILLLVLCLSSKLSNILIFLITCIFSSFLSYHSLSLSILVSELSIPSQNTTFAISISVNDIPDSPIIESYPHEIEILENVSEETEISSPLVISDEDENDELAITLLCSDFDYSCPFEISSNQTIFVANSTFINYHYKPTWTLSITVTDSYSLSSTVSITIFIVNVLSPPFFPSNSIIRSTTYPVHKNQFVGEPIRASGIDSLLFNYSIVIQTDNITNFGILPESGQLFILNQNINTSLNYSLIIRVTDSNHLFSETTVTVFFTLLDYSFSILSHTYELFENVPIHTPLLPALRLSGLYTLPVLYTLISSDEQPLPLSIDQDSAILYTTGNIDYEQKSSYSFSISVTDANGVSTTSNFTLHIKNINEKPVMNRTSCQITRSILEHTPLYSRVDHPLQASDPDYNEILTFSIDESPSPPFSIDPISGELFTTQLLNYHQTSSYTFIVKVTDLGGLFDTCQVTIDIIDENDPPEIIWYQEEIVVPEDTRVNSILSSKPIINDEDPSSLQFFIEPSSIDTFSANNEGQVVLLSSLNYEVSSSYSFHLCVIDNCDHIVCKPVSILVTDVNEPPVIDISITQINVFENHTIDTVLFNVLVVDSDNDALLYRITSVLPNTSIFTINQSGSIYLNYPGFNYAVSSSYSLEITVIDAHGLSSSFLLTINVLYVSKPYQLEHDSISIRENVPIGSIIDQIHVIDPDTAYSDSSSENHPLFMLNSFDDSFDLSQNGTLSTRMALNYYQQNVYPLSITICKNTLNTLCSTHSFTVNIEDVNDPPVLHLFSENILHLSESAPVGTSLNISLVVEDRDVYQSHTFFLEDSLSPFSVNRIAGDLFTIRPLSYKDQSHYFITLHVIDNGVPPLEDSIQLSVFIDQVLLPPITTHLHFSISENASIGTVVGTIAAFDPNNEENSQFEFSLLTSSSEFIIDSSNGSIIVAQSLDTGRMRQVEMEYQVSLRDHLQSQNTCLITIYPVNHPPVMIYGGNTTILIRDILPLGSILSEPFTIYDMDGDHLLLTLFSPTNATLPFSLIHTSIDQYSLVLTNELDGYDVNSYSFSVVAQDPQNETVSLPITILVQPINTELILDVSSCSIPEDTPLETTIESCTISFVNEERYHSILCSVMNSQSPLFEFITINNRCTLYLKNNLDYEQQQFHTVDVLVQDVDTDSTILLSSSISYSIGVVNVVESIHFSQSLYNITIPENLPPNTLVFSQFIILDPDHGFFSKFITCSIETNTTLFTINPHNCDLYTSDALDYELLSCTNPLSLVISASDNFGHRTNTSLSISIIDINEPPSFTDSTLYFTCSSIPIEGQFIGNQIIYNDPDEETNLLFIQSQSFNDNPFSIDTDHQQLVIMNTTSAFFTNKSERVCSVVLQVIDQEGLTDTCTIIITKLNDIYPPLIKTESFDVLENLNSDTLIGTILVESRNPSYSSSFVFQLLNSHYSDAFQLSSNGTLVVHHPSVLDYETNAQFDIYVHVTELSIYNITSTQRIQINLIDINEPPFVHDISYSLYEHNRVPYQFESSIQIIDQDRNQHHQISCDQHQLFSITEAHQLVLLFEADYEIQNHYTLMCQVTDDGQPSLSSSFTIDVWILDVNEPPSFTTFNTTFTIVENNPVHQKIGDPLTAYDPDLNTTLFYFITFEEDKEIVSIDSFSGQLTASMSFDYELETSYQISVSVSDGLAVASVLIQLVILDENDLVITHVPTIIDLDSYQPVLIQGENLYPYSLNDTEYELAYLLHYTIFDEYGTVLSQEDTENCSFDLDLQAIRCSPTLTFGSFIEWSLEWQSSSPFSVRHHHVSPTHSTIQPISIVGLSPTLFSTSFYDYVSFSILHLGSPQPHLYDNSTFVELVLVDQSHVPLTQCSFESPSQSTILSCFLSEGYGSITHWSITILNRTVEYQSGSFKPPMIDHASVMILNEVDQSYRVTIEGTNFGNTHSNLLLYYSASASIKQTEDCHFLLPHHSIECTLTMIHGLSLDLTLVVNNLESNSYHLLYDPLPPIITSVQFENNQPCSTFGGCSILLSGRNLGTNESEVVVQYYSSDSVYSMVLHRSCHFVVEEREIRCSLLSGSGLSNQWTITVSNVTSPVFTSSINTYLAPSIQQFYGDGIHSSTEGNAILDIYGSSFSDNIERIHVFRILGNGNIEETPCTLVTAHTHLQCHTVPGAGSFVLWKIIVDNLSTISSQSTGYRIPAIDSISVQSEEEEIVGNELITIDGSDFSSSIYIDSFDVFLKVNSRTVSLQNCTILTHTRITCITPVFYGTHLPLFVSIEDQVSEYNEEVSVSYSSIAISVTEDLLLNTSGGTEITLILSNYHSIPGTSILLYFNAHPIENYTINENELSFFSLPTNEYNNRIFIQILFHETILTTSNILILHPHSPSISHLSIHYEHSNGISSVIQLFGNNFGTNPSMMNIYLESVSSTGYLNTTVLVCNDNYLRILTNNQVLEGSIYIEKNRLSSNTVFIVNYEIEFESSQFCPPSSTILCTESSSEGNTRYGLVGVNLPISDLLLLFNQQEISVLYSNSTYLSFETPEGEGTMNSLAILHNNNVLTTLYVNYKKPTISTHESLFLNRTNTVLMIEGSDFGLSPILLLNNESNTTIQYTPILQTHSILSYYIEEFFESSVIVSIQSGDQISNSITVQVFSPYIGFYSILDQENNAVNSLSTDGNNTLLVYGNNFGYQTEIQVFIGDSECTVESHTNQFIECTTPSGSGSLQDLFVVVGDLVSNRVSISYSAPEILMITPDHGTIEGNTIIEIHGHDFSTEGIVLFNSQMVEEDHIQYYSSHLIRIVTEQGQGGPYSIRVVVRDQISPMDHRCLFSYNTPVVESIQPDHGSILGGTILQIRGRDLTLSQPTVVLGAKFCTVLSFTTTMIECRVPSGSYGSVQGYIESGLYRSNEFSFIYDMWTVSRVDPVILDANGDRIRIYSNELVMESLGDIHVLLANTTELSCSYYNKQDVYLQCETPRIAAEKAILSIKVNDDYVQIQEEATFGLVLSPECKEGFYKGADSYCLECPEGAYCQGQEYEPISIAGWWKYTESNSSQFYDKEVSFRFEQCYHEESCLGNNTCSAEYQSEKCVECNQGYGRNSQQQCQSCQSNSVLQWILLVVGIPLIHAWILCSQRYISTILFLLVVVIQISVLNDRFFALQRENSEILFSSFFYSTHSFQLDCLLSIHQYWIQWSLFYIYPLYITAICYCAGILQKKREWNQYNMDYMLMLLVLPLALHALETITCDKNINILNMHSLLSKTGKEEGLCYASKSSFLLFILGLFFCIGVIGLIFSCEKKRRMRNKAMREREEQCHQEIGQEKIMSKKKKEQEERELEDINNKSHYLTSRTEVLLGVFVFLTVCQVSIRLFSPVKENAIMMIMITNILFMIVLCIMPINKTSRTEYHYKAIDRKEQSKTANEFTAKYGLQMNVYRLNPFMNLNSFFMESIFFILLTDFSQLFDILKLNNQILQFFSTTSLIILLIHSVSMIVSYNKWFEYPIQSPSSSTTPFGFHHNPILNSVSNNSIHTIQFLRNEYKRLLKSFSILEKKSEQKDQLILEYRKKDQSDPMNVEHLFDHLQCFDEQEMDIRQVLYKPAVEK